jgi:hypothetical protein
MTVVQISDYRSPGKTPVHKRQRHRDRLHEYDRGLGSGVLIACGMTLAWLVVFIGVAGVGAFLG